MQGLAPTWGRQSLRAAADCDVVDGPEFSGELAPVRRPMIRVCVDWTEQDCNLAGSLGASILVSFVDHEWIPTTFRTSEIKSTPNGENALEPIVVR